MAKKLPWINDFTTNDLVINWEDDIYNGFPFLNLKENGLSMKLLTDLTAPDDNMVRGITKSGSRSVDGLVSQKLVGLRGSLKHGWDRTSWPIPFMFVNGEIKSLIDDILIMFLKRWQRNVLTFLKCQLQNM